MLPQISTGDLDKRITFQSCTVASGTLGEVVTTWADFWCCWALIGTASALNGTLTARDVEFSKRLSATVTNKILVRYKAGLAANMRIKYGTRYFSIEGVIDLDERHVWMHVIATELKNPT